jgi:long-chain fatty acid transport protein
MKKSRFIEFGCVVMFLCFTIAGNVFGGGFENTAIGMKGMSMGNGLTGIADDASAVYYNPGGLAFHEKGTWNAEVYTYFSYTSFKYKANSVNDESNEVFIIPGFFISKTLDNWAFGFGHYTPYAGGGTKYDDFQNTTFDLEVSAAFPAVTSAIAYKINTKLSVGMGISMYMGIMESKVGQLSFEGEFDEAYAGYGGHVGILYKPSEDLSVGFTARSEVPIKMDGTEETAGVENDSETEFTFPYSFDIGIGYKPDTKLTLGFILSYRFYSDMDEMTFKTAGIKREELTYYKDIWFAGIGIEYKIKSDLALKAGVKYLEGASKDKGLRADSVDVDTWHPTFGFAYNMSESKELNVSVMYNYGVKKKYNNQEFDQDHISLMLGLRCWF